MNKCDRVSWKKDCQVLLVILRALSKGIVAQLDISKTGNETLEFMKAMHVGAASVVKTQVRAL